MLNRSTTPLKSCSLPTGISTATTCGPKASRRCVDGDREVGALAVEHVAEEDAGEPACVGARPEPLGLDLDAEDAVDDHEGGLDDPQRGDGVGEEARIAGRVEEVEAESSALDVRKAGRQAELPALLVVVVVGDGRASRPRAPGD